MSNKLLLFKFLVLIATIQMVGLKAKTEELRNTSNNIKYSSYFDLYFQNSPEGHRASPKSNIGPHVVEGRVFDRNANQFTLNMAELSLKWKFEKVEFQTDFAIGEMVDQLSSNIATSEPTRNIKQAILSYYPTENLKLSAGKFYTHMGLEVTKAKDSWQYSRSYTFNFGLPFWHEGLSASYSIVLEKFSSTFFILNSWEGRLSLEQN